jgi:ubiquinone/menaquinone biosynthesis C-methylase UbiE
MRRPSFHRRIAKITEKTKSSPKPSRTRIKTQRKQTPAHLMAQNFRNLPFEKAKFDFVFDMNPKK